MAIPPRATALDQPMDPSDTIDFGVVIAKEGVVVPAGKFPVLRADETIASFTVALTAEAMAAGLQIKSDSTYPPPTLSASTNGPLIVFWLSVDPSMRGSPMFDSGGVVLPVEVTVTTSSAPPRVRQKTVTVGVANQ